MVGRRICKVHTVYAILELHARNDDDDDNDSVIEMDVSVFEVLSLSVFTCHT